MRFYILEYDAYGYQLLQYYYKIFAQKFQHKLYVITSTIQTTTCTNKVIEMNIFTFFLF